MTELRPKSVVGFIGLFGFLGLYSPKKKEIPVPSNDGSKNQYLPFYLIVEILHCL
jgi:hypothetical protein